MPQSDVPSLANEFYQRFLGSNDRVAFLRALVNSNPLTFETEWLEFKPYPYQKPEETIKEVWSKELSAFGNSQGGVLIWGIGAREVNRIDAARSIQLVPEPDELRTRLFELHHQATDPPLSGVEIHSVIDPNENGKGFVVCFIPQGDFVPYRSEHCRMNYYVRIGDDSIVPSRIMLRRLFYPQSRARIAMSVVLSVSSETRPDFPVRYYRVFLANVGNATANDLYVMIQDNVNYHDHQHKGVFQSDNWHRRTSGANKSGFYSAIPIHPGFSSQIATSNPWVPERGQRQGNHVYHWFKSINIKAFVYSRDAECQSFEVEFNSDEQELAGSEFEKACTLVG